jgi:DNA (cytosine-5)-methyltransferase 1
MKKTLRKGSVYYNEHDPAACEWLRELMKKGSIPEGDIDERSIADVQPEDLKRYTQCHFFAGIGGWPLALRLAGVQDLECWTGSCPCQPFSTAGKNRGTKDERHLWPQFRRLIAERRPQLVVGEQVEAAVAHGWLDLVSSDLEAEGYAVGSVVMGAHGVGAPHIRQRLYWCGVLGDAYRGGQVGPLRGEPGEADTLADARCERPRERQGEADDQRRSEAYALAHAHRVQHGQDAGGARGKVASARGVRHAGAGDAARRGRATGGLADAERGRCRPPVAQHLEDSGEGAGARAAAFSLEGFWDGCEWLHCRDGKARPAEPGVEPLAHGVPRRVELLRGYGNAIVPQVAATFVKALIG